jgi:hypothetical protein
MPQNDKDLKKEFAYANFDVRHRWVSSWVWDIPMGGNNWLLNGWRLAGMFTAQTAQPFTVNSSFDVNQDGNLTDRLNAVDGITSTDRGPAQYVLAEGKVVDGNGSSMLAGTGKDGSIGRNSFRARGIASLDLSLLKTFRIDEQRNFEFRTEFFNFFNRTHFGVPVRILEAPSFGQAVDTALNPRNVQFALKFNF